MDVKTCWCEIFFNKFKGFRPSTGPNKRGGGVVETASTTNQSINHKPDHLHEFFEYSGTSISMSTTGWPPVSNEQQREWRERRMTGGGADFWVIIIIIIIIIIIGVKKSVLLSVVEFMLQSFPSLLIIISSLSLSPLRSVTALLS